MVALQCISCERKCRCSANVFKNMEILTTHNDPLWAFPLKYTSQVPQTMMRVPVKKVSCLQNAKWSLDIEFKLALKGNVKHCEGKWPKMGSSGKSRLRLRFRLLLTLWLQLPWLRNVYQQVTTCIAYSASNSLFCTGTIQCGIAPHGEKKDWRL